ncbi:MAG: hypothetical protein SVR94_06500 [Pseudomonadota bacterium]|nr:hypothetical protein [Pseudomonadota bacterium]
MSVIDLLCCMDSVKIIVKGHTREYQNKTGINDSNIVYDAKRKTADLIEWADVILFWSTSVAIEGFIKNKTMVCLNYITANKNLYQLYNTGYIANCRDDLLNFVIAYMSNTHQKYYNIDGIEKFMCDVVYAGNTKRPVYINYLEFMSENEITV